MYTPMLKQYLRIKQKNKDKIIFFRLGDFYEMFFDDAKKASKILDIVLTSRNAGDGNKVPMCGIPYHSADSYIHKLVEHGEKVAICEQIEDAKHAKGLVKRAVVSTITPGTLVDSQYLAPDTNNYLISIAKEENCYAYSYLDVSTGQFRYGYYDGDDSEYKLYDKIKKLRPSEILICDNTSIDMTKFNNNYSLAIITGLDKNILASVDVNLDYVNKEVAKSLAIMLQYVKDNQSNLLKRITEITFDDEAKNMILDSTTINNLELIESLREKKKSGSLFHHLDQTKTAMGSRMIREWILNPLLDIKEVEKRQATITVFIDYHSLQAELVEKLKNIIDIERLIAKLATYNINGKDLVSLAVSLDYVEEIRNLIENYDDEILNKMQLSFKKAEAISDYIHNSVNSDPPASIREGDIIADGYNDEVDRLRKIKDSGENWITELEQSEKEKTGIKNLKVGYNKVFGYYLEVTKSNLSNVPDDYIRKQTLSNSERYITPELKDKEEEILNAQEKLYDLEYSLFQEIVLGLLTYVNDMQLIARDVAILDSLSSLCNVATRNRYIKPRLVNSTILDINEGRHPVIERVMKQGEFIPNDINLNNNSIFHIITGPNMSGKSTFMRQTALIIILAQIGSYVPATHATIGVADRVFTRVGASDDIFSGQSTFMVEMNEVANICKNATSRSFVILDEIGRGTSTYDGMSIARAVSEYLLSVKCRVLFATHYHELVDLEDKYSKIKNYSVAVYDDGDDIVFLHKIIPGASNRSYGIHVCKLAGIPQIVINKAEKYLKGLEKDGANESSIIQQLSIDALVHNTNPVLEEIQSLKLEKLTPIEALNLIYRWQTKLSEELSDE